MMNRRAFIKDVVRTFIAGALLAGSSYLLLREQQKGQAFCGNDFVCKGCKKRSSCSLPEAKHHREKENDQLNQQIDGAF